MYQRHISNSVFLDLKNKSRKGDETNKPLLSQVNHILRDLRIYPVTPVEELLRIWMTFQLSTN